MAHAAAKPGPEQAKKAAPAHAPAAAGGEAKAAAPAAPGAKGQAKHAAKPAAHVHMPDTVSLGSSSPEVRILQLSLQKQGLNVGPVDGIFGPLTQKALIQFQGSHGLDADGIAGPKTWAALRGGAGGQQPVAHAPTPGGGAHGGGSKNGGVHEGGKPQNHAGGTKPSNKGPTDAKGAAKDAKLREEILKIAGSQVGTKESGTNRGDALKYANSFGRGPEAWCADFVSWVYSQAGKKTNSPYCPTFVAQLKKQGKWKGKKNPQPGDLVFFDWDGDGSPDHVGIVQKANGDGSIETIEGNTHKPGSSTQEGVYEKHREKDTVLGYGAV